jgi:hypothetical protein
MTFLGRYAWLSIALERLYLLCRHFHYRSQVANTAPAKFAGLCAFRGTMVKLTPGEWLGPRVWMNLPAGWQGQFHPGSWCARLPSRITWHLRIVASVHRLESLCENAQETNNDVGPGREAVG